MHKRTNTNTSGNLSKYLSLRNSNVNSDHHENAEYNNTQLNNKYKFRNSFNYFTVLLYYGIGFVTILRFPYLIHSCGYNIILL